MYTVMHGRQTSGTGRLSSLEPVLEQHNNLILNADLEMLDLLLMRFKYMPIM